MPFVIQLIILIEILHTIRQTMLQTFRIGENKLLGLLRNTLEAYAS